MPRSKWFILCAPLCLFLACAEVPTATDLEQPHRLYNSQGLISNRAMVGHAGPKYQDYDGDGLPDLMVAGFAGMIELHKNVGTRKEPQFEEDGVLMAEGEPLRFKNW